MDGGTMRPRRQTHRSFARLSLALFVAAALVGCVGVIPATADLSPSVTLAPVSAVTYTSAQLKGTVNPNGGPTPTNWHFEYSLTGEDGTFQRAGEGGELSEAAAEGTSPVPVEESLVGLEAGRTYFVRLVATNEFEQNRAFAARSFATESISPPTVSIAPPAAVTGTTASFSGVIDPEGTDPAFAVHWHFQCTPECPGLEGDLPAGTSPATVESEATGLLPGTAYQVTLVAKNAGEPASAGPERFTTATIAPTISGAGVTAATAEAQFGVQLNAGGAATSYYAEYGPTPGYGSRTPAKVLSALGTPQGVAVNLTGLAPSTTYHARFVATNAIGSAASSDLSFTTQANGVVTGPCPNETIRVQQGSTRLPDCRAYEMVSPVDKNGGSVSALPLDIVWQKAFSAVSPNGEVAAFWSYQAFANSVSSNVNSYRAARGSTGWDTVAMNPPTPGPGLNIGVGKIWPVGSTKDLSHFFLDSPLPLVPQDKSQFLLSPTVEETDAYTVSPGEGVSWISQPDGYESSPSASWWIGSTSDGKRLYFQSERTLVPEAAGRVSGSILYERADGHTKMVGLDSAGEPVSTCGSILANSKGEFGGENYPRSPDYGAISEDGSRVYFTSPDPTFAREIPACEVPAQLYLRSGNQTTEVSRSRRSTSDPDPSPAVFQAAAENGGVVYFSSNAALTEDASLGADGMLYAYRAATDQLELVVPSGFENVLISSNDGSRVYYVRDGSIYVYSLTDHQSHLIATAAGLAPLSYNALAVSVTPDGSRLLFQSRENLTGYDSDGFLEVYLYDAASQRLTCVSCQAGRQATADSTLPFVSSELNYPVNGRVRPRYLNYAGNRAFFQTTMALVSSDVNGAADVYEWHDGTLSLVSDGRNPRGSYYFGASDDGSDIFITTAARLVSRDHDDDVDIYDARVDGGFVEPTVSAGCVEESCQGAIANAPSAVPSPGTASIVAPKVTVKKHQKKKHHNKKHPRKGKQRHAKHRKQKGKKQNARKSSAKSNSSTGKAR
jgi:hypothetical protein